MAAQAEEGTARSLFRIRGWPNLNLPVLTFNLETLMAATAWKKTQQGY